VLAHGDAEIDAGLLRIWQVMQDCVRAACARDGTLPGGFKVRRRAAALYQSPDAQPRGSAARPAAGDGLGQPLRAGGQRGERRRRARRHRADQRRGRHRAGGAALLRALRAAGDDTGVGDFLLTAGAIGLLYKENASISGAEVGCQGEVGVACSMAAGACARCSAARRRRWRTPPRSAWSTTSA
jgi:L-serine dehydratase